MTQSRRWSVLVLHASRQPASHHRQLVSSPSSTNTNTNILQILETTTEELSHSRQLITPTARASHEHKYLFTAASEVLALIAAANVTKRQPSSKLHLHHLSTASLLHSYTPTHTRQDGGTEPQPQRGPNGHAHHDQGVSERQPEKAQAAAPGFGG